MGAAQSDGLSASKLEDIRRSTNFTASEIQQWYDKFNRDFPDGVITKDAFVSMYSRMFPKGNASGFAEHIFRVYDQDGNGEIDFDEFISTLSVASKGTLEEKIRWAFSMYDLDGNGYVSRQEAIEIITSIFEMRGIPSPAEKAEQTALQLFLQLDKDQDDSLSEREFVRAAKGSPAICELLTGGATK